MATFDFSKIEPYKPKRHHFEPDFLLSDDQNAALKSICTALHDDEALVTLGGYAGSGKSTLIPFIMEEMGDLDSTAFCCYTGKAANVLRSKLRAAGMEGEAGYIGTTHGLLYKPHTDEKGNVKFVRRTPMDLGECTIRRVVIDEVSMVGAKLMQDLLAFGIQILAVGDPAQLPPIGDDSVIKRPDFLLSKIHRQAQDNPIIQLAAHIRETGQMPKVKDSEHIRHISYEEADPIITRMIEANPMECAILARTNKARTFFNQQLYGKTPEPGHTIVCLKNDIREGIVNGMRGTVMSRGEFNPKENWFSIQVHFPAEGRTKFFHTTNVHQFGREKKLDL